ncbi:MAG: polyketide cyclase [Candidatus Melainabacteria bacterium HGW-Melainabacteria-1]|nr:MAG: polyketide cyclase [Candidatus Melainabacteria bacterium HGW-Melainabacteria-1]
MQNSKAAANSYFFVSHWRVPGKAEQVFELFRDVERLPQWWPAVYLNVEVQEQGGRHGIGRRVALRTRGWLPYSLNWQLTIREVVFPSRISLDATGDLLGQGTWHLAQDGEYVDITYDWEVLANKPLLKWLSPLLKPLFAFNHRWAMRQGEASLRLELQRMQAPSLEKALEIPPPPGPEPALKTWALLGGAAGLLTALAWGAHLLTRRKPKV